MIETSTYKKRLFEFYELYHESRTNISGTTITVDGKNPHADVIASSGHKLKRTRVYVNGIRATITEVAANGANTDISVLDTITLGDIVDIYLATNTGTLANNTGTGKFPLVELQTIQNYGVKTNSFDQVCFGSGRKEFRRFESDGVALLGTNRRGNNNFKNFIMARQNGTYLMILVKDSTNLNIIYDILHEVRVESYKRLTRSIETKDGIITDLITFRFVPEVSTTAALQHATSFDDTTLSGTPTIIKFQNPDYFAKVYPTASVTANEVSDPIGTDVLGINDATLSGTPLVAEIISGETKYYIKVYPTISAEVVASTGIVLSPVFHSNATLLGTPRILAIPINGTNQYIKGYPHKV